MSHQRDALEYCKQFQHPALFMEMRLGKTLVAIRHIRSLRRHVNNLVLAPLTVLEGWKRELTTEGEEYLDLHDSVPTRERLKVCRQLLRTGDTRKWILLNYEALLRTPKLSQLSWDSSTLDESVKIKNPRSKITKICTRNLRGVKTRMILTGLPRPESDLELYSQFQYLDGDFMDQPTYWHFQHRFFRKAGFRGYELLPKNGVEDRIKKEVHERAFVLSRADAGLGSKKICERRVVEMTAEQKKLYKQVTKDFAYQRLDGTWNETQWAMTAAMWLQRICGGFDPEGERCLSTAKGREILRLLEDDLKGEQVVVWFRFRSELELVHTMLKKKRYKVGLTHGGVTKPERGVVERKFKKGQYRILLATEKCAKMGLDYSTSDTAIYYSNEWSCDDRLQSEDRIVSTVNPSPLLLLDLVTRGTVDEDVVEGIRDKSFKARDLMKKFDPQKKLRGFRKLAA